MHSAQDQVKTYVEQRIQESENEPQDLGDADQSSQIDEEDENAMAVDEGKGNTGRRFHLIPLM